MSATTREPSSVSLTPQVNFIHLLNELSVNSRNPCEVLRELISNAYDARATEIRYYPLLQLDGFIFFDNGTGMSHVEKKLGITPWEAFFSIGYTTKTLGESIGYKCQGAKLCFACDKFILITRCDGESGWRVLDIDNPRQNLSPETDISPKILTEPWKFLASQITNKPQKSTQSILDSLDRDFFTASFQHGTMIVVVGFESKGSFLRLFGANNETEKKLAQKHKHLASYVSNYVRFYTRHGDVRILNAEKSGFSNNHQNTIEMPLLEREPAARFFVWYATEKTPGSLMEVPAGYPYLDKPETPPSGPKEVSQLKSGRFYARHADTFEHKGQIFTWILAIDGHKRALEEYDTLGRQGRDGQRSGITLASQRGPYLCAHGIKVCEFRDIFANIDRYRILANSKAFHHYLFLLDGPFELVTDRNAVKASDIETLLDRDFLRHIEKALDGILYGGEAKYGENKTKEVDHNAVFASLLERLENDIQEEKVEKELAKIKKLKSKLKERGRFKLLNGPLKGRSFLYPGPAEENWVGVLYSLFAHFASSEEKCKRSKFRKLWIRPVNMAGVSIDALAVPIDTPGFPENLMKGLEYKRSFSHEDVFNHPLGTVDYIVCWEFTKPAKEGVWIKDEFDYMGCTALPTDGDARVAYDITDIQRTDGTGIKAGAVIKVISLKELIRETFDCEMIEP